MTTMTDTTTTVTSTVTGRALDVTRLPWTEGLVEVRDGATAEEMLDAASLNWDVAFSPLYRPAPDVIKIDSVNPDGGETVTTWAPNVDAINPDGTRKLVEATDIKDVTRVDRAKVLGQVRGDYVLTQNRDAFSFADHLVESGNASWIAGGSQYDDKVVYGVMRLNGLQVQVGGEDPIDTYVIIRTSHNGGTGIQVYVTPIRLACANMMTIATKRAKFRWSIRHVSTLQGRLQEARDTLQLTTRYVKDGLQAELDKLLETEISEERARWALGRTIPPTRSRRDAIIEGIMTAYHDPMVNGYEGTAYGMLNAVTDYYDHTARRRSATARLQETLDGEGMKMRDKIVKELVNA